MSFYVTKDAVKGTDGLYHNYFYDINGNWYSHAEDWNEGGKCYTRLGDYQMLIPPIVRNGFLEVKIGEISTSFSDTEEDLIIKYHFFA